MSSETTSSARRRPNILFVLADDLGQGDVSCFNPQAGWRTTHLDRLAAEGMRFTDSHATSALCTPSRYGALTGRYNWRSRLKSMVLPGDSEALIEKDRLTLPAFLSGHGYRTAVIGKWHLGLDWQLRADGCDYDTFGIDPAAHPQPARRTGRDGDFDPADGWEIEGIDIDYSQPVTFGPNELGFDYSFITAASLDQPPYVYVENGQAQGIPTLFGGDALSLDRRTDSQQQAIQAGPMVPGYDVGKVAAAFHRKSLEVLDDLLAAEEPWFLYVPSHLVHGPIVPDAPFRGASGKGPYGDFVLQFDAQVGELVERIDAAGAGEDTVIIVTSDNGASGVAGLPHLRSLGHDPSNGWRGHKSDIWEGGHREPFIVRWPGTVAAGSQSAHTVAHCDIFATLAEVLGAAVPEAAAEDSISNLSLWLGRDEAVRTEVVSSSGGGGFAIRQGDWKLACVTGGDGMDALAAQSAGEESIEYRPAQLYDLAADPGEEHNLLDERPEVVAELAGRLAEIIRAGRSTPGPACENAPATAGGDWYQIAWIDELPAERAAQAEERGAR